MEDEKPTEHEAKAARRERRHRADMRYASVQLALGSIDAMGTTPQSHEDIIRLALTFEAFLLGKETIKPELKLIR